MSEKFARVKNLEKSLYFIYMNSTHKVLAGHTLSFKCDESNDYLCYQMFDTTNKDQINRIMMITFLKNEFDTNIEIDGQKLKNYDKLAQAVKGEIVKTICKKYPDYDKDCDKFYIEKVKKAARNCEKATRELADVLQDLDIYFKLPKGIGSAFELFLDGDLLAGVNIDRIHNKFLPDVKNKDNGKSL